MDKKTILQLNELNKQFYKTVGNSFDQTRQSPWLGWYSMAEIIEQEFSNKSYLKVVDVGCGNGRFGLFLKQKLHIPFKYTGIDSDQFLLTKAQLQPELQDSTFIRQDILHFNFHELPQPDVIVLFGVIHHLPSFKLRQAAILQLTKVLKPNGLLLLSAWQFPKIKNFDKKVISVSQIPYLDSTQLETNDYFLGWDKKPNAIRYCHHVTEEELNQLTLSLPLKQIKSWEDDGTNLYTAYKMHS